MSSLYSILYIFCQFEAAVLEFVTVFSVSVQYTVQGGGGEDCVLHSWTLAGYGLTDLRLDTSTEKTKFN
jgi:hypothetical protein